MTTVLIMNQSFKALAPNWSRPPTELMRQEIDILTCNDKKSTGGVTKINNG